MPDNAAEIERLRRENEALKEERRKHEEVHFQIFHSKLDAIALDVRAMSNKQASQSNELRAVVMDTKQLGSVLLGNGHPERGIAFRLNQMEETHKTTRRWTIGIAIAATGALVEAILKRLGI